MESTIDLAGIGKGDPRMLAQLYKEYQPDFVSWSRKQFGMDSDEAREIFQESVVTLYENVINGKLVDMKSSIKTYLFAIGKNKTMEFLRRSGRQDRISDHPLLDSNASFTDDELGLESDTEMFRKHKLMKACIVELGDTCQNILTMFYFSQLSLAQIREKLSYKNEESVKSQKFKCMERLRSSFQQKYQGWL